MTNPVITWFWNKFFLNHGKESIIKEDDVELKKLLLEIKEEINEVFQNIDTAIELKKTINLDFTTKTRTNGTKKNSIEDLPAFKKLMDLV